MKVVPLNTEAGRPAPPDMLTKPEAEEWKAVVSRMPADWFKREHHAMLEAYCSHACRYRFLRLQLDEIEAEGLPDDLTRYDKLAKAAERESRAVLACGRSLRITHQSQYDPKQAARDSRNQPTQRKPWESR